MTFLLSVALGALSLHAYDHWPVGLDTLLMLAAILTFAIGLENAVTQ